MKIIEREKKAMRLVESARILLDKAELSHGQPLFYDKNGSYVDVVSLLWHTADEMRRLSDFYGD